jgi:hypothetical protein
MPKLKKYAEMTSREQSVCCKIDLLLFVVMHVFWDMKSLKKLMMAIATLHNMIFVDEREIEFDFFPTMLVVLSNPKGPKNGCKLFLRLTGILKTWKLILPNFVIEHQRQLYVI